MRRVLASLSTMRIRPIPMFSFLSRVSFYGETRATFGWRALGVVQKLHPQLAQPRPSSETLVNIPSRRAMDTASQSIGVGDHSNWIPDFMSSSFFDRAPAHA